MADQQLLAKPEAPAVAALKDTAVSADDPRAPELMERSVSMDIREERDDLKRAAEQSLNAIMDLNLDGTVRWMSPTFQEITGIPAESMVGKPIVDYIRDNKSIFADSVESIRKDDSKSRIIRFAVECLTPKPPDELPTVHVDSTDGGEQPTTPDDEEPEKVVLEAQGIMVYDRSTSEESHTMWMIKPAIRREITIDLPEILVESLGIGAHVLAQYLNSLADAGAQDPQSHPPPLPVLCRICERQITPWWFEKHTELCSQEHRAEMEVQIAQDALTEHRAAIVRILDALEAQAQRARSAAPSDGSSPSPTPQAEYKGLPIGPAYLTSNPSSGPSSSRGSPAPLTQPRRSRERSNSALGHHQRARSFAVRRPLARIVELILDLCDTALEISTPTVKENPSRLTEEIRTQSPQSESRISQVLQWQSPSAGTLEHEEGLSMLCDDTAGHSKAKVEAVFRCRSVLEYSERIRMEFDVLVQECIDAALVKAARLNAGEMSESSSCSSESDDEVRSPMDTGSPQPLEDYEESRPLPKAPSPSGLSAMALALRSASADHSATASGRRDSSAAASSRSNSPGGTKTPRSVGTVMSSTIFQKRGSIAFESDAGGDSDSSVRSSLAMPSNRPDSPGSELSLSRTNTRGRKRTGLNLPSLQAMSRQESPAASVVQPPLSPLRSFKPRLPSGEESSSLSPITSPALSKSEFSSPVIRAQHHHHHRRQSSVALGDGLRAPSSPHLTAISSNPQPKAVQTSIKDFEIIKPISKGAFGSVYLAKKKLTGDYYAIKVLKKGDMVAKNQITNVKAERAIMMWQGESDFVAKLYWTFASKDYLYLVMEYLNGGDCASLIKSLGGLTEEWAKKYVGEVVLGVQHLHSRQIVHRDLKPDNLLIDQKGHLKLTDFGLSRMGLVGRQKRMQNGKSIDPPDLLKHGPFRRAPSIASSRSASFDYNTKESPAGTPSLTPSLTAEYQSSQPSYFSLNRDSSREATRRTSGHRSDSGDSDALQNMFRRFSLAEDALGNPRRSPIEEEAASEEGGESPDPYILQPVLSNSSHAVAGTPPQASGMLPPPMALFDPEDSSRRFVGTPDYLAPETINGIGQDEMSDWWSLGCILFESLYGCPPFHAETPDEVFQNILNRDIHWPDEGEDEVSDDAKDLMLQLMTLDPQRRLGANNDDKYANGGDEIRAHPWFTTLDWTSLRSDEASFIPAPANMEDTEYFDARGASLQNFSMEFEDQESSPAGTPGADYPERPHDALSKVRTQVNSIKRGLMPLHIPPHVRDGRSRRSSEPAVADDFGNFQFKNLPVLERENKNVLSKLRAEAMQAQAKSGQLPTSPAVLSPAPSLEASPIMAAPIKRALSANKGHNRPASPSLLSQANASPNRVSQPSSPLLVSFSAGGQHHERRKTSSGSSSLSQQSSNSLQPGPFLDNPGSRLPVNLKVASSTSSPIKTVKTGSMPLPIEGGVHRKSSLSSPRPRSHTLGSPDGDLVPELVSAHQKRRSQVLNISPSSSDNEDQRTKALLRVQRRRQSSRRLSQVTLAEGPMFRPLDVLVCEDHPVSRLVMERLLEKLRCRTISVQNGSEAMRYAMSEVKFDIIMMEFKLPQINGADVARMIRDTKNANAHTPIVAVTGYLKELQAPHYFDALVEKPPTTTKLTEVMDRLCQWKPPPPGWTPAQMQPLPQMPAVGPSGLRKASIPADQSPTDTSASSVGILASSYRGSSREDSITSGSLGDADSQFDSIPVIISRTATNEWPDSDLERNFGGLGISDSTVDVKDPQMTLRKPPTLRHEESAPAALETPGAKTAPRKPSLEAIEAKRRSHEAGRHESAESGDDEDEELGDLQVRARSPKSRAQRSSKLSTEMLRTNSQGSVISGDEVDTVVTTPVHPASEGIPTLESVAESTSPPPDNPLPPPVGSLTPPEMFPKAPGDSVKTVKEEVPVINVDMDVTPKPAHHAYGDRGGRDDSDRDPDPTPRANHSPTRH